MGSRVLRICMTLAFCGRGLMAEESTPTRPAADSGRGMVFLHYADSRFLEGLKRHDLLASYGLRLLNTGYEVHRFGEKWSASPVLAEARSSGQSYYFDRITGGMAYQPLDGITAMSRQLKEDPRFLGFQVHEWGNSPMHDHRRIQSLLLNKGLPFDREHFATYEGRVESPYFSGGDYEIYKDLFKPLKSLEDVEAYLGAYFRQLVRLTEGQIMAVNGYVQLYHAALRLGAKNVMAEVGNQVPLSALQIACVRGAARQYGRPFGVYYETWGGAPFGCSCATSFSPWLPQAGQFRGVLDSWKVGARYGSSRSLQRRLLYFSWLSGATYYAEEWGAENYFADWETYPLTEYGRVVKDFLAVSTRFSRPRPVVPAALVMPPGTFGIDVRYLSGASEQLYDLVAPDRFHVLLRRFTTDVFAPQPARSGGDGQNLTPSPWIGCFDVLSADAPAELLGQYGLVVYFDREHADKSSVPRERVQVYQGEKADGQRCIQALERFLPFRAEGKVGCAHARSDGRYLLGIFNNVGITKSAGGETGDPRAAQSATVRGSCGEVECLVGGEFVVERAPDVVSLRIPAGDIVILSFPDRARTGTYR